MNLPKSDPKHATIVAISKSSGKQLGTWHIRPGDTITITFSSKYEQLAESLWEEVQQLKKQLKGTVAE